MRETLQPWRSHRAYRTCRAEHYWKSSSCVVRRFLRKPADHSVPACRWSPGLPRLFLNLLASLASAVAAVIALIRPAALSGSNHVVNGEFFYVHIYAARSSRFGLTAGILPFLLAGQAVGWVLFTTAVIRIADVVITIGKKDRRMVISASVGATVHLLCGVAIIWVPLGPCWPLPPRLRRRHEVIHPRTDFVNASCSKTKNTQLSGSARPARRHLTPEND
jgi:hypothetical protein